MTASHAAEAPLFAVCYDIADDRERRQVSRLLCGYGYRCQKSVFECRLTAAAHRRIKEQLSALVLKSGHVRLYRVYAGAASPAIGVSPKAQDAVFSYSI